MFAMRPGREFPHHLVWRDRLFCFGGYTVQSTYPPGLLAGCPPKDGVLKGVQSYLDKHWPDRNLLLVPKVKGEVLPRWTVTVEVYSTPMEEPPPEDADLWTRMTASDGSMLTLGFMVEDHTKPMAALIEEALETHAVVWEEHAGDWGY